jgi:hypothetical protein
MALAITHDIVPDDRLLHTSSGFIDLRQAGYYNPKRVYDDEFLTNVFTMRDNGMTHGEITAELSNAGTVIAIRTIIRMCYGTYDSHRKIAERVATHRSPLWLDLQKGLIGKNLRQYKEDQFNLDSMIRKPLTEHMYMIKKGGIDPVEQRLLNHYCNAKGRSRDLAANLSRALHRVMRRRNDLLKGIGWTIPQVIKLQRIIAARLQAYINIYSTKSSVLEKLVGSTCELPKSYTNPSERTLRYERKAVHWLQKPSIVERYHFANHNLKTLELLRLKYPNPDEYDDVIKDMKAARPANKAQFKRINEAKRIKEYEEGIERRRLAIKDRSATSLKPYFMY